MPVWIKQGVMGDLCPELQKELGKIIKAYRRTGREDFYITSKREGTHIGNSFHYIGQAVDFRKDGLSIHLLKNEINQDFFDLVEEPDHFHLEYDPK